MSSSSNSSWERLFDKLLAIFIASCNKFLPAVVIVIMVLAVGLLSSTFKKTKPETLPIKEASSQASQVESASQPASAASQAADKTP